METSSVGIARTEQLLEAMRERVLLLHQLRQLSGTYDAAQLHDGGLLLGVLGRKSNVIDCLSENQVILSQFAEEDPESRQWLSTARREECQRLAQDAQRILREIIDHEQSMLDTLTMQRDAVAAQLQQGRDSVLASYAYNSQAILDGSTLDISD